MPAEQAPELRGRAALSINFMQQQYNNPPPQEHVMTTKV